MPRKIANYKPKPFRRMRRYRKSRFSLLRQKTFNKQMTYNFKRTANANPAQILPVVAVQNFSLSFNLAAVPNVAEFTGLFDSYRINYVVLRAVPIAADSQDRSGTALRNPYVLTVLDFDDDTAMTSESDYQQYSSLKTHEQGFMKKWSVGLKPQIAIAVYRSATTTGYMTPGKSVWLDCSYPDIPHYGIKMFIQDLGVAADLKLYANLYVDYYLSFKGIR